MLAVKRRGVLMAMHIGEAENLAAALRRPAVTSLAESLGAKEVHVCLEPRFADPADRSKVRLDLIALHRPPPSAAI